MLGQLIRGLAVPGDGAVEVVGEVTDLSELAEVSAATEADAVVLELPTGELPAACRWLLVERPHMFVLGLTHQGRRGLRWQLRCSELDELSPELLVAALTRDWEARDRPAV
jgi:hypothetical protein